MPRQTHTSGRRLRESRTITLAADLLRRGARTKTVERLTGLGEVAIRDVYREIFSTSPNKGPSAYAPAYFTSTHLDQLHSTLARLALAYAAEARNSTAVPSAPELGFYYVQAFDAYAKRASSIAILKEPMCFERFAQLAHLISRNTVFGLRRCLRCDIPFLSDHQTGAQTSRKCPSCRILPERACSKCGAYCSLDFGDLQPRRKPMCKSDAAVHRPATYARAQYRNPEILDSLPSSDAQVIEDENDEMIIERS